MKSGKFIVFEGGEKSGKSTQIEKAQIFLENKGLEVLVTREPGGTGSLIAEKIRDLILDKNNTAMHPRTELLLFLAARAQHIEEVVKPALVVGKIVLCDRFDGSTFAYQGAARNLDLAEIKTMNAWAKDYLEADAVIYFEITPEQAAERIRSEKVDRLDAEKAEFHQKVRAGYLSQVKENANWHIIPAVESIADVSVNIQKIISLTLNS